MPNTNQHQQQGQPTPWAESRAKKLLERIIEEGRDINENKTKKKPSEVFVMHTAFNRYKKNNFATNLRALRKKIKKEKKDAKISDVATKQFLEMFPPGAHDSRGRLRWENSEAKRLLRIDIKNGLHETMKPSDLRALRSHEYKKFDSEFFRKKIYQESKRVKQKYHNELLVQQLEAIELSDSSEDESDDNFGFEEDE
jgi:hypothetical protein